MYMLNGWWFLSSGGSYPPVFMVDDTSEVPTSHFPYHRIIAS